ncbi:hypothetical protein COT07_00390 [Candidatus Woesearchaeota archaeon CG07_land_8_20_14_0_80_44_23]|nr:MAG: hypothetical protein COT07_00390 [Candidatus Woesearchaeota archaeon CG07_land_8_20_14_0_80_44_23]
MILSFNSWLTIFIKSFLIILVMNKIIEKLMYSFGINISGYNVKRELDYLHKNLPDMCKNRDVVDIGCGDGKISLKLIPILKPKSFLGIDLSKSLIKSAKKRGINAKVLNIENQEISGDLGIIWGVLHHLNNPIETLKKLKKSFNGLIIRESIDEKRLFELGHKLNRDKLIEMLEESDIDIIKIIEIKDNKSLIILTK